jgi:hypothetical protein
LEFNFSPYAIEILKVTPRPEGPIIGLSLEKLPNYNLRVGYFLPSTERAKRKPHFDRQRQRGEDGIHLFALTMPKAIYFVKAKLFAAQ